MRIKVIADDGRPLAASVAVRVTMGKRANQGLNLRVDQAAGLALDAFDPADPLDAHVVPDKPGYWSTYVPDIRSAREIVCHRMSGLVPPWWHQLLGQAVGERDRGAGIRIGVADVGFQPDGSLTGVRFVAPADGPALRGGDLSHGEAICRILHDRSAPPSCAPVAPGSDLIFIDAAFSPVTVADAAFIPPASRSLDSTRAIDPKAVANAIFELALSHDVHIVNLSLGIYDSGIADTGVAEAIRTAADAGALVICAAGNRPGPAAFPARLPDCVGVAAFGSPEWTPKGSFAREFGTASPGGEGTWRGHRLHHWRQSASGDGVDTIAPGIGILIARDGVPFMEMAGTSFAAPIVAGLLAVELAGDGAYLDLPPSRARMQYARARLMELCAPTGMRPSLEGRGLAAR